MGGSSPYNGSVIPGLSPVTFMEDADRARRIHRRGGGADAPSRDGQRWHRRRTVIRWPSAPIAGINRRCRGTGPPTIRSGSRSAPKPYATPEPNRPWPASCSPTSWRITGWRIRSASSWPPSWSPPTVSALTLRDLIAHAFAGNETIRQAILADLQAVVTRDPASRGYTSPPAVLQGIPCHPVVPGGP